MLGAGFHFHYSPWKAITGPLGTPPDTHLTPIAQMLARQGRKVALFTRLAVSCLARLSSVWFC